MLSSFAATRTHLAVEPQPAWPSRTSLARRCIVPLRQRDAGSDFTWSAVCHTLKNLGGDSNEDARVEARLACWLCVSLNKEHHTASDMASTRCGAVIGRDNHCPQALALNRDQGKSWIAMPNSLFGATPSSASTRSPVFIHQSLFSLLSQRSRPLHLYLYESFLIALHDRMPPRPAECLHLAALSRLSSSQLSCTDGAALPAAAILSHHTPRTTVPFPILQSATNCCRLLHLKERGSTS